MFFGFSEFFLVVGVTLFLGLVPKFLDKIGFFLWLGRTEKGKYLASVFGSPEPSVFLRGLVMVLFFITLGFLFLNGVTTDAINYKIHEPAIKMFESCANDFTAVQVGLGEWNVFCNTGGVTLGQSFHYNATGRSVEALLEAS